LTERPKPGYLLTPGTKPTDVRVGNLSLRLKDGILVKESDIRPEDLMAESARLTDEDALRVLALKEKFVQVACPACDSPSHRHFFEKKGYHFVSCRDCRTVFVNPRPTSEILAEYYAGAESIRYFNEKIFPSSAQVRREKIFLPRVNRVMELVKKYALKTEILVDVGAGFGTFCEEIKRLARFSRVIAVEPAKSQAETCRQKGLEVIAELFERVRISGISVITCFELLEHLFSPKDFLTACMKALEPGGLLILTTPNIQGFDLQTLGLVSDNIGAPDHLNYFHPRSLTSLLQTCGFELVELSTPGQLDVDIVRNKILKGEFDISGCPFLKHILIEEDEVVGRRFQEFLVQNHMSSHMWGVARKI